MLKVWLPLNGDLHNQGCSNVTVTNNGTTVNASGKIGSCYYFNASSYLYENTYDWTDFNTSQFSLCCWYKQPSPVASGNSQMICIGTNSGWNNIRIGLLRRSSNGYPMFSVSDGSNAVNYNCTATKFSLDTWNHIVCTYNAGEINIYLNGEWNRSYTTTIVPVLNSSQHLGIGAASNGAEKLTGYLNDVRIYDHCLSAAEVKEISQGLVLHYKLDSIGPSMGNPNLLLDGMTPTAAGNGATGVVRSIENGIQKVVADNPNSNWCTFGNHNTTLALTKGDTFTFSLMIRSPDSNKKPTVYFQSGLGYYGMQGTMSNNWSIIYYTGTWSIDNLQTNIHLGFSSAPGTYYIKYFKLEKGDSVTPWAPKSGEPLSNLNYIEDSSGYNYNGTINGNIIISSDTNRYNCSTQFDGVDDSITVPYNTICPENIFTFNLWFKKDALGSKNYETLFGGPSGFEMDTRAGSATTLSLYMASTRSTKRNLVTELSLGNWYMITMTRDGTKEKYYVNGIFQSEIDAKSMPNGIYRIGAWASNTGQNYYGLISDFRIYCTALDADDILQLYHTSAKIDNKKNLHTYELIENSPSIKINKRGQTLCNELQEGTAMKFYKTDSIIETNVLNEF